MCVSALIELQMDDPEISQAIEKGEAWLILSDLAEHLGLRSRATLLDWIDQGGLAVIGRADVRPSHPRVFDAID